MAENTTREGEIVVLVDGVQFVIEFDYIGDTMPKQLDQFIKDHLGGRPDDR